MERDPCKGCTRACKCVRVYTGVCMCAQVALVCAGVCMCVRGCVLGDPHDLLGADLGRGCARRVGRGWR